MKNAPTVVVTGATGFLGGHILSALQAEPVALVAAARDASRVPDWFSGEIRVGDLTDPSYRDSLVHGADVVIHAGTWSSFWGHAEEELERFLLPALGLIDASVAAGVDRFIAASSVTLGTPARGDGLVADDSAPVARAFWPHHSRMVDAENHMRSVAGATRMISLRLGHFIGEGNELGLVAALIPRLTTRQVPWVGHGRAHLPLVSGADMGRAFARAATAPRERLEAFEAVNIVGPEQPTVREVFEFVAREAGVPAPSYSVPRGAAHAFGSLMELLHPWVPGRAPFLTRSLVFVGNNWHMETNKALRLLGYRAIDEWREVVAASVEERREGGFAWPALAQA